VTLLPETTALFNTGGPGALGTPGIATPTPAVGALAPSAFIAVTRKKNVPFVPGGASRLNDVSGPSGSANTTGAKLAFTPTSNK
jgi:hypothetical protein